MLTREKSIILQLKRQMFVITILLLAPLLFQSAYAEGNASDPTASVNYTDLRFRSYDLGNLGVGDDRDSYAVEGAIMLSPGHKLTYEVHYWDTNFTGRSETGLESLHLKYINLTPRKLGNGTKYVIAAGAEIIEDVGDVEDGIGLGADQIAPLFGAGWNLGKKDFLVTLVQYFHSYDEDSDAPQKIRTTAPRLIWIHKIPQYKAWIKLDNKFSIDHENDNDSSNIFELQIGTMITPNFGVYVDYINNNAGTHVFDDVYGLGIRMMY